MSKHIALLPGDGIGPEVIAVAREVLQATGLPLRFTEHPIGWAALQQHGSALPVETLAAARSADGVLLGAVQSPSERVAGYRSPVVALRHALDLWACLRPVRTPPLPGARQGVDLVVVRENSEGLYSGRERRTDDEAVTERVITRAASERIAHWTVGYARANCRRRRTVVHKANILRETDGLFRETVLGVLVDAPELVVDELLVDTAAYHMVRDPERFDILLTTNLFGDILSDAASAWGGGLGLAVSANLGHRHAVFEPVHGAAPDIAGRGVANPLAAVGAGGMLLDHLGYRHEAARIAFAVAAVLEEGSLTPDLGGTATTHDVLQALLRYLSLNKGETQ